MNFSHLKTIAWLRWRLIANGFLQVNRIGRFFTALILVLAGVGSVVLCLGAFVIISEFDELAHPSGMLLFWCGVVAAFLLIWTVGVITDLQRSEPLPMSKFLHLPVSPQGAFLNNFLGSYISFSMILAFPVLLGFSFGMINVFGFRMMPGILLLFTFVLFLGAITYQFRGWLAAVMIKNKRRQRTIIACMTFGIIFVSQIPNMVNLGALDDMQDAGRKAEAQATSSLKQLSDQFEANEITAEELTQRTEEITQARDLRRAERFDQLARLVRYVAVALPFGWLPVGMESLARGGSWVDGLAIPLACGTGLLFLSILSLRRSFKTTLRLYRGETGNTVVTPARREAHSDDDFKPLRTSSLMDKKWPWLNEQQSAIASGSMIGLLRAPEAKLALLTPFLVMLIVGGSFVYRDANKLPVEFRAFTAMGVVTFAMLGIMQLINNLFGYDRSGFRCMVLAPVRGVDVLIGKNMAFAPFAFCIGALGLVAMQIFLPMSISHVLATLVQLGSIFLITCMISNLMAIKAPLAIAAGTMKPMNLNVGVIVLQLLITILLPICLIPTMIPPGVELLLVKVAGIEGYPIYLILSILWLAATLLVYRFVVRAQGRVLEEEEQKILEVVTQVGT